MKLVCLLATNSLPFLLMDVLSPFCSDIFPDSKIAPKIAAKRTKINLLINKSLGKTFKTDLYELLKVPGCFFSIVMDETTDISVKKQCAFTVIYF